MRKIKIYRIHCFYKCFITVCRIYILGHNKKYRSCFFQSDHCWIPGIITCIAYNIIKFSIFNYVIKDDWQGLCFYSHTVFICYRSRKHVQSTFLILSEPFFNFISWILDIFRLSSFFYEFLHFFRPVCQRKTICSHMNRRTDISKINVVINNTYPKFSPSNVYKC